MNGPTDHLTGYLGARGRALRARARRLGRVHTRTPFARHRARLAAAAGLFLALLLIPAGIAAADPGDGATNTWLTPFVTKDSHGIAMSAYLLNVDEGGVTNPKNAMASFFLGMGWDLYRMWVGVALWLFDFALQFKILDVLRVPAGALAEALQSTIEGIGIIPAIGTLALCVCGVWIINGKAASGFSGVLIALFMGSLLTSAVVKPVDTITGDDGLIVSARDLGVSIASQVVTAGDSTSSDPAELQRNSSAKLVDVFVRSPHGLINYGAAMDTDEKCVKVYDEKLKEGYPVDGGKDDGPRKAMGKCNEGYLEAADNPTNGLTGLAFLYPAGGLLVLFFFALAIVLSVVTAFAIFEGVRAAWTMLMAIFPGEGSRGIWESLATVALSLVTIVCVLFGIGAFLMFFEALMTMEGVDARLIYILVDGFLLAAIVVLVTAMLRVRKSGKKIGADIQKKVMPAARSVDTTKVSALQVATRAAAPVGSLMASSKLANAAPSSGPATTGTGADVIDLDTPQRGGVARLARASGKAALNTGKLGLAATVGAPVYAPRAAAALKTGATAKRDALGAKLTEARERAAAGATQKKDQASAFGREYVHNVGVAAKSVGKVTGGAKLAGAAMSLGADPVTAGAAAAAAMHLSRPRPTPAEAGSVHRNPAGGADRHTMTVPTTSSSAPQGPSPSEIPSVEAPVVSPQRASADTERERLLGRMRERHAARGQGTSSSPALSSPTPPVTAPPASQRQVVPVPAPAAAAAGSQRPPASVAPPAAPRAALSAPEVPGGRGAQLRRQAAESRSR